MKIKISSASLKTWTFHVLALAVSLPAAIPIVAALFHLSGGQAAKITAVAAAIAAVASAVLQLLKVLGVKVGLVKPPTPPAPEPVPAPPTKTTVKKAPVKKDAAK